MGQSAVLPGMRPARRFPDEQVLASPPLPTSPVAKGWQSSCVDWPLLGLIAVFLAQVALVVALAIVVATTSIDEGWEQVAPVQPGSRSD